MLDLYRGSIRGSEYEYEPQLDLQKTVTRQVQSRRIRERFPVNSGSGDKKDRLTREADLSTRSHSGPLCATVLLVLQSVI